jgi:hypothetical protein
VDSARVGPEGLGSAPADRAKGVLAGSVVAADRARGPGWGPGPVRARAYPLACDRPAPCASPILGDIATLPGGRATKQGTRPGIGPPGHRVHRVNESTDHPVLGMADML